MSVYEWHAESIGKKAVEALKKNNFDAVYCATKEEAVEKALSYVTQGAKVGMGGSMTTTDLGLTEKAAAKGAIILNHNLPGLTNEQKMDIRRQQLVSDVFLTSTNALTIDGCLLNVDGSGNRVAAMIFGPKKVIVITGYNKIVPDMEAAYERLKMVASPMNNKRIGLPNPCVTTGVCQDCQGKTRICNAYTILRKKPSATDMTVIVVGEQLGY